MAMLSKRSFLLLRRSTFSWNKFRPISSQPLSKENYHQPKEIVHVTQVYPNRQRHYAFSDTTIGDVIRLKPVMDIKYIYRHYLDVLSYFLPKGFPHSVHDNYGMYAGCQSLAYIFSSACSVLSMQALLQAIGVGAGAIPLAATLNWILKDGIGQFGGVVFAAAVNNQFDSDPKRWRMISTLSMDVSSFIELLTPLAPGYFLPLASLANVGKNISFLSASASRAAIHKSFAIHENLADITAKSGSQTVLASLLGTSLGVFLASQVGSDFTLTTYTFLGCSAMNILLSYLSLRHVTIYTLSVDRFDCLYADFLQQKGETLSRKVMRPDEFSKFEHMLGSPSPFSVPLTVGVDFDRAILNSHEARSIDALFKDFNFMVTVRSHISNPHFSEVFVLLKEAATKDDMLHGMMVAHWCRKLLVRDAARHKEQPMEGNREDAHHQKMSHNQSLADFMGSLRTTMANHIRSMRATVADRRGQMRFRLDVIEEALRNTDAKADGLGETSREFVRQLDEKWASDMFLFESRQARIKDMTIVDN